MQRIIKTQLDVSRESASIGIYLLQVTTCQPDLTTLIRRVLYMTILSTDYRYSTLSVHLLVHIYIIVILVLNSKYVHIKSFFAKAKGLSER